MPNTVIETQRHGLWIAAAFILALVALVMSFSAHKKVKVIMVGTQTEVLVLDQRLDRIEAQLRAQAQAPAAAAAPAEAPAAAPAAAK